MIFFVLFFKSQIQVFDFCCYCQVLHLDIVRDYGHVVAQVVQENVGKKCTSDRDFPLESGSFSAKCHRFHATEKVDASRH